MKKILILMARFGGGHEAIAKAMKNAIDKYGQGNFEVTIEDGFPPILTSKYGTTLPFLSDQGYKITNNEKVAKILQTTSALLLGRRLQTIIRHHNPDLIIVDHAFLITAIKNVLLKFRKKILLGVYFADAIKPHKIWFVEKQADCYFAPTRECEEYALANKITRHVLFYTGWILRQEFYNGEYDKATYKKNLGFEEDKLLIYLSGGGDGFGKIEEIVAGFLRNKFFLKNCQIAIICGVNHKLLIKMQKIQRKMPDTVFSLGYIKNTCDYKKAADLICSKAGPNDIFESIILSKPFFAHNWLWLHEIDNFKWVKKKNIGFADRNPRKIVAKIIACLKNPELLHEKIENVKKIRVEHVNAPQALVKKIEEMLQ
jgi:UDP-N-acetylglucosamine:LPS N-acetylglucosamine transferase